MPITTVPQFTQTPSMTRPGTFAVEANQTVEEWPAVIAAQNAQAQEVNILAAAVDEQSQQVADAAAIVGATKWLSGENVAAGLLRWSPTDGMVYRHKTAGVRTTDPALDPTNWWMIASVKKSGNYVVTFTVTAATAITLPTSGTMARTEDIATQAEAEAGASSTKFMTPLRTAQEITALKATQAQMEAKSGGLVTPENLNWHPGAAKAWIKCDAAGNINASYNITSITDTGIGLLTVTLATDFSSANYVVNANGKKNAGVSIIVPNDQAAGYFTTQSYLQDGTLTDPSSYLAVCFGDQ